MKIIDIQAALSNKGYRPGPLDGIWGRQTTQAVRDFQSDMGLKIDGIVGPATLAALMPNIPVPEGLDRIDLIWFKEARRLLNTKEIPGKESNNIILDWSTELGISYKGDDIPWCGLFVGHCIGSSLPNEPLPSSLLRARSWKRFGVSTKPTIGAVMVFWRGTIQSGDGHVGFYAGEDNNAYRILGGNQSDSVSLAWIRKDRLVASRWPSTVPAPVPVTVTVERNANLSYNEA